MISANLKYLRKSKAKSQEEVANDISIKRTTLSGYENGSAEPNTDNLIRIADYYSVSLDALLREDLSARSEKDWSNGKSENKVDITGAQMRVIATTVNQDNIDNIELVPVKACAGYTTGYADPEYIRVLPTFQLPFLSPNKKYRTFPITGDSMPPHKEGSFVVGQYTERLSEVVDGKTYILVTKNNGIVYKRLFKKEDNALLAKSDNVIYEPYEVKANEIIEIWRYACSIATKEFEQDDLGVMSVKDVLQGIREDFSALRTEFAQRKA
jgi:transcriptional regulator with XRE-family HTH domain